MNLPAINNAFQNIKNTCQDKLKKLYPKGIPEDIQSRYVRELSFLEHSNLIDDFEIFRRLSDETKKNSTIMNARGTLAGSILYFLLGNNSFIIRYIHITTVQNVDITKQWIRIYLVLIFLEKNVRIAMLTFWQMVIICR